ncbi:MAG: ATP-binding cassette domain-containing protein [Clostridia bacterium]|nr:ATP-binding cassette domain-containing protein [Clostridia bacterium]
MSRLDQTDTKNWDIAVKLTNVSKEYVQPQRVSGNLIKQLLHPEKKRIRALVDVSFEIRRGEFVAYAGPNGAGKSTTFKLLCGMLSPNSGTVRTLEMDPLKKRIPIMKRTGVLFGGRSELWWDHPVVSSFEWKKEVWDIPRAVYDEMLSFAVKTLEIDSFMHAFVRELSFGQRMRAELAMLLLHAPELILLDEPTIGLDVLSKQHMIEMLTQLNKQKGTTILVTSHDMDDLMRMARRVVMINHGQVAFDGDFQELMARSGSLRRFTVTATHPLRIAGVDSIRQDGDQYVFEVDTLKTPMRVIIQELMQQEGIEDIESEHAPIEDVIARLYEEWNNGKGQ